MLGVAFIIGWLSCSILNYGLAYGYMQGEYEWTALDSRSADRIFALFMAATGPVGLPCAIVCSHFGKHGLRY